MRYHRYAPHDLPSYKFCILVSLIQSKDILDTYITPFGIDPNEVLVVDLHYSQTKKKTPVAEMKEYISSELVPIWEDHAVEYIICTDSEYFKQLAGVPKTEAYLGYVLPSAFGSSKVVYAPSHRAIFYDPEKTRAKINQAMVALCDSCNNAYVAPGDSIIHFAGYPTEPAEIERWLCKFLDEGTELTADIEGFSLKHYDCGVGTIAFAWSKHEGIAFPVDLGPNPPLVRAMLRAFFEQHNAKIKWHGSAFDLYVLIYQLFMEHILDTEGLLYGLEVMLKNWDCTRLISYLATNSCAGNANGLKIQAQEFAGNYAVDSEAIKDIRQIPLPELLEYNLVDALSTWYVYEKHWDTLVADDQLEIYNTIFKPATVDIIQMQLTGLPVNMKRVAEVKLILQADEAKALDKIHNSPLVQRFTHHLNEKWVVKRNTELKVKRVTLANAKEVYNPNSGPQTQALLYEMLALPVLGKTESGLPSTDKDNLKALCNHTKDPEIIELLNALLDFGAVSTILSSFIPAMENAQLGIDGWHYMFGNFNLGGTLSGRLSSSNPNLQNIPATGSRYAKLIKTCFSAPPGWLFGGLDFDSLEDKISAVTTKDPNKLKVYQGHIVYGVTVNGVCHHIRDDATVNYEGISYTGEEFYEKFSTAGALRT